MFEASSLLLLTLVLNVQLCTAAPILATAVQTSGGDPEELTPVTEDHSHFIKEKESAQEKLIPVVAGEAAPPPEESPAEEDIPVIVTEPELVSNGDQVSDDADEAVSQESAPEDPLAAAPQVSSEEEIVPVESAFAEASPDETAGEVAPAVAAQSQSPEEHYEENPAPEALIPVILLEASEDEALEGNVEEAAPEEPLLLVPDDNTEEKEKPLPLTPEEEKAVVLVELETVEAGQGEPDAGEPAPHESAPEDQVVTFILDPAEREPDQEEQEETVPLILSETKEEEALEEHAKEEEAFAPVVLEENAKEDHVTNEEPLPSTLEVEEPVVLVHAELESQEEADAGETTPVKPAVIVLVEPPNEETAPEDPILIIPLEDRDEHAAEDNTEEVEIVQSDPLTQEAALEEDTAPQENEAGNRDAEILVSSVGGTPSETETIEKVLNPGEEVPVAATEVHVATPEPVTTPSPAVTDEQAEIIPASVERGGGTMKTHSEDFEDALTLTEEEPVALVHRGAVLGAVFFILMALITIGIVWTTVSKKLR